MSTPPSFPNAPSFFVYLTCQRGAEPALKAEMAKRRPTWRFSYSRPGFLTFKLPEPESIEKRLAIDVPTLRTIFARCCVGSLGKISAKDCPANAPTNDASDGSSNGSPVGSPVGSSVGSPAGSDVVSTGLSLDDAAVARRVWELAATEFGPNRVWRPGEAPLKIARIHVFERDRFDVGTRGFEPGLKPENFALHRRIYDAAPAEFRASFGPNADRLDAPGEFGEIVLDVAVVAPNEIFVGFHRVSDQHSRYPGGLFPLELPTDAASRAFLKFEEGLRWAGFPIGVGSRCVDIGSAPGGGSQALLARGAETYGVDPAEMDERVLANPNFVHLRGKINQLKRKNFQKVRWFLTDMNVAPNFTLDALEEIVTRKDVAARGLLFTLKFFDWKFADDIPLFLSRVKSWGFNKVKARQLQFNRQEIMVAAMKKPFRK